MVFNGMKMRELRRRKRLTQQQMADLFEEKISKSMIGFYENGEEIPTESRIQDIAKVLEVEESELMGSSIEKNADQSALVEEYRTMLEFMKAEMTKLNDQNTILVKLLSSNFLRDNRAFGPDGKVIHLWPVIQKAAGY
jgi:transcriptional regulator with XRE-family HTH domain